MIIAGDRFPVGHALALSFFFFRIACSQDDARGVAGDNDMAVLRASRLECLIGNNKSYKNPTQEQHHAGYNGVFSITSPDQPENPFVTTYAGLNLEHFFDARQDYFGNQFFEPRHSAMYVRRISPTAVELHQPTTKTFGVESWTRFDIVEPYYLDFSFRFIPHQDVFQGGFMGVFWASYINGPLDKSTYFLDGSSKLDKPLWRQLCTQQHNRDSTIRSVHSTTPPLSFEEPNSTLFSSISPLRYGEPFFYGRFRNMVLIYTFQPNVNLRFAHSPSGGGRNRAGNDTNPAWDFQLIVPNYEVGKEYSLKGRLVYKEWVSRDDVISEVKKFRSAKPAN